MNITIALEKSAETVAAMVAKGFCPIECSFGNKSIIDDLYVDKTQGLVDKDMYKRIYDKTKKEIDVIELELKDLIDKRRINENQQKDTSLFNRCKKSVLDYMSLRIPTKEQINRLVEKIEIDQDKKVYVYLKFPELLTDN